MECHCFAGRGISRPQQHRVMVSPLHLPPISHLLLLHLLHLILPLQPHLHQSPNPSLPPSWSSPTNLLPHCWRECLEWILPLINSKSKVVWITCSLLVLFQIFQTFHCGQAWRWKGPCLLWSFLLSGLFLHFGEIMLNVFQLADGVWVEGPGTYKYTQSHLVTSSFKQILGFLRF